MPYLTGFNILNSNKTEIEEETKKSLDIIIREKNKYKMHLNILVEIISQNI